MQVGVRPPEHDEVAGEGEHRAGVVPLGGHVALGWRAHRQPSASITGGESAAGAIIPREGRALGVASGDVGPVAPTDGVAQFILSHGTVRKADLVALVDHRSAPQGEQRQHDAADPARVPACPSGGQSRGVEIGAGPYRPGPLGQYPLGLLDHGAQGVGGEVSVEPRQVEGQVELVCAVAVEGGQHGEMVHVGLSEEHSRRIVRIGEGPPSLQDLVHLGSVAVVDEALAHELFGDEVILGGRWVVA